MNRKDVAPKTMSFFYLFLAQITKKKDGKNRVVKKN